jgi:processive 1,2-diacylglycerol beta-glucosyltransferase
MKRVDIVYFDAGSGHRSAAKALQRGVSELQPGWQVNAVNFVDVVVHNKLLSPVIRKGIDYFNWLMVREKVADFNSIVRSSFFWRDRLSAQAMRKFWGESPPDLLVSVTPIYNPVLYKSLRLANPLAVCVTVPVDYYEVLPGYWFTPQTDQQYLIATDRLMEQAREAGIPESSKHHIGGMIIDPDFYERPSARPREEIAELGLDPSLPTGIVSFGGQGHHIAADIAQRLSRPDLGINMIFLCGRNELVFGKINGLKTTYRKLVLGYMAETPIRYLQLADFLIGKPGSMTMTEALVLRKPLIAIKSKSLAPVQKGHEDWIERHGTGIVIKSLDSLTDAIRSVLSSDRYRQNAAREHHRGIFDAADILCSLAGSTRLAKTRQAGL